MFVIDLDFDKLDYGDVDFIDLQNISSFPSE